MLSVRPSPRTAAIAAITALAGLVLPATAAVAAVGAQAAPVAATYADVCDDATSGVTDLRRLVIAPNGSDTSTYQVIVEGCQPDAVGAWDVLVTTPSAPTSAPDRRVRFQTTSSAMSFSVLSEPDGALLHTGVGERSSDGWSRRALVPATVLAPMGSTLRLRVQTTGDQLPDGGRPAVTFPSPCAGGAGTSTSTLLRVDGDRSGSVAAIARTLGAEVGSVDAALGAVELDHVDDATLDRLRRVAAVREVRPATSYEHLAVTPNDPAWSSQWAPTKVRAPEAWAVRDGSQLRIAIVDDGVDGTRPDLAGRVGPGYDPLRRTTIPGGANSDLGGHGTSVAGLAAARGNDGTGMAGIDWSATVLPYRVFDEMGCASEVDVAAGIRAAADAGAHVINLSLGGPDDSSLLRSAVDYAVAKDAVLVAASGNSGAGAPPMYPAADPDVIAVGATTSSDTIASYSNRGSYVEVTAPGDGVVSLAERDGFARSYGTSFAAPIVAGAVALYRAEHPTAGLATVRGALAATAVDLGQAGRDPDFGYGRLDLAALLGTGTSPTPTGTTPLPTDGDPTSDPAPTALVCEGAPATGFVDLTGGVHDANIACLVYLEVTSGIDADRYAPIGQVTRGQMATFLVRAIQAAGGELPTSVPDAFADDDGTTHETAADLLASVGVVAGTAPGRYEPGEVVTRGQMATFLARAYAFVAGEELPAGADAFADDDGTTHEANIDRVVAAGIASGRSDGTFGAGVTVRRDQMATFLVGLLEVLAGR